MKGKRASTELVHIICQIQPEMFLNLPVLFLSVSWLTLTVAAGDKGDSWTTKKTLGRVVEDVRQWKYVRRNRTHVSLHLTNFGTIDFRSTLPCQKTCKQE